MAYSGNPGKRPIDFSNVGEDSQEIDQRQFVSTQESIGDANLPPIPPTEGGSKGKSWVWQHFEKTLVQGSSNRYSVSCKICANMKRTQKPFSWQSGSSGTGTLSRHLNSCHNLRNDEGQIERGQTQISGYATPGGGIFSYSRETMIDEFGRFIIGDELPFSQSESTRFERFVKKTLQPQYKKVPRNTLKRAIYKNFHMSKVMLVNYFANFNGRVALTSDTWTTPQGEPYICVTCHWIDNNWILQKRIIGFELMEESHTAFNLKERIINVLDEFELRNKVFSISLDNASSNTRSIDFLLETLSLPVNGQLLHIRCCAHVLNLCVQEGLNSLTNLVEPIRKCVKWLRYNKNKKKMNLKYCVHNMVLKKRHFSLDTPTRWNSTYKLLCETAPYHEVITILYNSNQTSDACVITTQHWEVASNVCAILQSFDSATKSFSLIYEPNVHLVVTECITIVSTLTSFIEDSILSGLVKNMIDKFVSYFSNIPYIYGLAAILDPNVGINGLNGLLDFYYNSLQFPNSVERVQKYINDCSYLLKNLYEEYSSIYAPQSVDPVVVRKNKWHNPIVSSILKKSKSCSSGNSSEIDTYLTSNFEINDNFHILTFWKGNEPKFPILSKIAKDVFACPASTVASESAFSAGKRVLDDKRSSLAPESIKICVMKKDWDAAEERTQDQLALMEDDDIDEWLAMDTSSEATPNVSSRATSAGTSDQE